MTLTFVQFQATRVAADDLTADEIAEGVSGYRYAGGIQIVARSVIDDGTEPVLWYWADFGSGKEGECDWDRSTDLAEVERWVYDHAVLRTHLIEPAWVGYDGSEFKIDSRVELHPATNLWMRGARFGTVKRAKHPKRDGREVVIVHLDKLSDRNVTCHVDSLRLIQTNPTPTGVSTHD